MRGLWQPGLQSGLMGDTPCLPSSTLLGCPGITQVVPDQRGHNSSLDELIIFHFFPLSSFSSDGKKEKGLMSVSVKEFEGLSGKDNRSANDVEFAYGSSQ